MAHQIGYLHRSLDRRTGSISSRTKLCTPGRIAHKASRRRRSSTRPDRPLFSHRDRLAVDRQQSIRQQPSAAGRQLIVRRKAGSPALDRKSVLRLPFQPAVFERQKTFDRRFQLGW